MPTLGAILKPLLCNIELLWLLSGQLFEKNGQRFIQHLVTLSRYFVVSDGSLNYDTILIQQISQNINLTCCAAQCGVNFLPYLFL